MDVMLQNIKLKKAIECISNLAKKNQELKESVISLSSNVEDLKRTVDILNEQASANNSADNILGTLEYALTRIREYELMGEDE
ncbi:hypothetical protein [Bacillus paramycoides]|uniref:hypothetical protein n=1 Tax=Bacillus paramycoides TaxID=2026194 RepID=UPI002E1C716D|nr:hypothetical protein [Bacillus paramycoides]